jgi:hypothetical protein
MLVGRREGGRCGGEKGPGVGMCQGARGVIDVSWVE